MGNIRGSKSGNQPQGARWFFTPLDYMFMWALSGVLLISPILEWAIKFFLGAFPTNPGWGNYVVGYICWFFIFISVRLTVFLPEQHPKCKLLAMAFFFLCLSINIEPRAMAKPGNIACTMNLTTKLIQNELSTNISWKNLQPFIVERHAPANGRGITKIIPTAGHKIKIKK